MNRQKTLFMAAACILLCAVVSITDTRAQQKQESVSVNDAFPDVNFRTAVSERADRDGDGFLTEPEIAGVTELEVRYPYQEGNQNKKYPYHDYDGIQVDVTGMELFVNLKSVSFENVEPAGLSFGKFSQLETFCIDTAPEMELDFSETPGLKKIKIINMELKKLDVSHSGATEIYIHNTKFTTPFHGFAGADHLKEAWIYGTDLEEIDFTPNTKLKWIYMERCSLKEIHLEGLKNLEQLSVADAGLKSIDVSDNKNLEILNLRKNQLTKIDVSRNHKLDSLSISENPFAKISRKTVKVSDRTPLRVLHADHLDKCAVLDVSHIEPLKKVYAYRDILRQVKIGKNLACLDISWNKGMSVLDKKSLQAPDGAKLKKLECNNANLTKLDVSHLKKLEYLDAEYVSAKDSRLKKVDVSGNLKLYACMLDGNSLKKLVVNKNSSSQKKMYRAAVERSGGKLVYKE